MQTDDPSQVRSITNGPRNHFYGYYGQPAWSPDQRYHLTLETDFHERRPTADDRATVALVRMENGTVEPFAETPAFNLQQGAMMQWIDVGNGAEFTFNDWDGRRLITRVVNPDTKASRVVQGSIAAVAPSEPFAVGLDFVRMFQCRKVVGYAIGQETVQLKDHPEDDGIWTLDLATGEARLTLSIADVIAAYEGELPQETAGPAWFNHILYNPDGSRLLFLCRLVKASGGFLTSMWSANTDGSELTCLIPFGRRVSHFAWQDSTAIVVSTDVLNDSMQFVRFHDQRDDFTPYGDGFLPDDGHLAFSPDGEWLVCDTYPRKPERLASLILLDLKRKRKIELGRFHHADQIVGDHRCDLHPRWRPDGNRISFDSVHEGSRQMYEVDVARIVSDA